MDTSSKSISLRGWYTGIEQSLVGSLGRKLWSVLELRWWLSAAARRGPQLVALSGQDLATTWQRSVAICLWRHVPLVSTRVQSGFCFEYIPSTMCTTLHFLTFAAKTARDTFLRGFESWPSTPSTEDDKGSGDRLVDFKKAWRKLGKDIQGSGSIDPNDYVDRPAQYKKRRVSRNALTSFSFQFPHVNDRGVLM